MVQTLTSSKGWLTLREACKRLGVSPATLRQWADAGKVQSFRTPGGHRRFLLSQLDTLAIPPPPRPKLQTEWIIHNAIGKARMEITSGRLDQEKWHSSFNATTKELHRQLGQRLMSLLLKTLHEENQAHLIAEAQKIGREYARVNLEQGTPLEDTLRAFLFFRDYVFDSLIEISASTQAIDLATYRRLNKFANEMLITIVQIYSGETEKK
jgi:excisionase family DNA binding protein